MINCLLILTCLIKLKLQFPLTSVQASTVTSITSLQKQKSFGSRQIYIALSKVKNYINLYGIWEFKKFKIKINKDVLLEYERLKGHVLEEAVPL